MSSLFSEFFTKFGGVIVEVCETISEGIWEVFGGNFNEHSVNLREKSGKFPEYFRETI